MPSHTCKTVCNRHLKEVKSKQTSLFSLLLIIILPNCPFCIMAYTSAITICGGSDIYLAENNWASYIPILLSLVIVFMLILNKRGVRTHYALAFAFIGTAFIILVHQLYLSVQFYYVGTSLLFLAIGINSSFLALYVTLKKRLEYLLY